MTSDHFRQNRPHRRFRRLLAAAVASVTLATSVPFVAPSPSHAAAPRRLRVAPPPVKLATVPRGDVTRGESPQGNSAM
jgi:hypothetical protein